MNLIPTEAYPTIPLSAIVFKLKFKFVQRYISSILCSSFAKFGIILFFGGVFRLARQRRRGGGNIRTVKFVSIFLV